MSVAVFLATHDRVVAASDSRARDGATYADTTRKVHLDGTGIFAASGHGDLALDAWRRTPAVRGESAEARAKRIVPAMEHGLIAEPEEALTLFGICQWRDGRPDVHALKVRIAPMSTTAQIVEEGAVPAGAVALVFGWDDQPDKPGLVRRDILPTLTRAPTEAVMVQLARDLIARAAEQSLKVGGAVFVAVLDAGGPKWV
ncbi:MAG: hypothetical protein ABI603_01740 [Acidobacteriota bacterium]